MVRDAGELLLDALRLGPEARAALAASILESLDDQIDEDAEQQWRATIRRRIAELDSGTVQTVSWVEVRARLEKQLRH